MEEEKVAIMAVATAMKTKTNKVNFTTILIKSLSGLFFCFIMLGTNLRNRFDAIKKPNSFQKIC